MEVEKLRNLNDDELALEERKTAEALFRLRFQMKLGQTEGVKKLRELRKDIARIKTVTRQRELGVQTGPANKFAGGPGQDAAPKAEVSTSARPARRKAAKPARKKAAKTAARRSSGRTTARRSAAKPSANKKKAARSASVKKGG